MITAKLCTLLQYKKWEKKNKKKKKTELYSSPTTNKISSVPNTTVITSPENRNSSYRTTVIANGNTNNNINTNNSANANNNDNQDKRPEIEAWMILLCFVVVGFIFVIMTKLKQNEYDKEHNTELYNLDSNKQEIKR